MKDLLENNPAYPNLKAQHLIDDDKGMEAMKSLNPVCVLSGTSDQTFLGTLRLV